MQKFKVYVDSFDVEKVIEADDRRAAYASAWVWAESIGCGYSGVRLKRLDNP
jgi:asparagine synthetase A